MKKNIHEIVVKYILSHRITFTIIFILVGILFIFLFPCFLINDYFQLNNIYETSQIVATIYVIIGTVIAVWQYYISSRASILEMKTHDVEKAIDLAGIYKNEILSKFMVIRYVFEKSGILAVLSKIPEDKMIDFNNKELKQLWPESRSFEEMVHNKKFTDSIVEAMIIFNLIDDNIIKIDQVEEQILKNNDGQGSKKILRKDSISVKVEPLLNYFFNDYISCTLNNLEFFSMHFTHGIADETVVYQSLHQSYLTIIHYLYFAICKNNIEESSKYYTNAIKLYNIWRIRKKEKDEIVKNNNRAIPTYGTTISKDEL